MKRFLIITALVALLTGCSWIGHHDHSTTEQGGIPGADLGPSRGTTGVSSGDDSGHGITGSDVFPR